MSALARRAGILCTVGGGITAVVGGLIQVLVVPSTKVSDQAWSYPWRPESLIVVSLGYTLLHLIVLGGLVGFLRCGVTGTGHAARYGGWLLLAGTVALTVGELASILVRKQTIHQATSILVGVDFGVAILLTLVGLIMLAVTTARTWAGWRRWTPLAAALATTPLLALNSTHYLATGVAVYGLGLAIIGIALLTNNMPVDRLGKGHLSAA